MPAAPQGLFHYPGINQILSGTFTLSHGVTPSSAIVKINPETNFAVPSGTMSITYGNQRPIEFPDCSIDMSSLQRDGSGQVWSIRIQDRRWKWKFGEIYGRYNGLNPDGRVDVNTDKTPQELATLLLQAMGETNFDVSDLPNKTRPYVDWLGDNPAEQLESLVESLGCRVVLGTDNRVRICLLGNGSPLPPGSVLSGGFSFDPPDIPDELKLICAPTQFQARVILEAVGLDTDGQVKLLKDLSYNPANANATQTLTFTDAALGGTYTLTLMGSQTSPIAYNASAAAIQAELELITGPGNVTVTGTDPFTITFVGTLANTPVATMSVDSSSLVGASGNVTLTKPGLSGQGEPFGWIKEYPETLPGLIGTDTISAQIRSLALKTVYRWYRIKEMATGDLNVPGYGPIKDIKQILPLQSDLLDTESGIASLGERYPRPMHAQVTGRFYSNVGDPATFVNRPEGTPYPGEFSIDEERGIVEFSQPVYQIVTADTDIYATDLVTILVRSGSFCYMPAQLMLECVFNVHDEKTNQAVVHTETRRLTNGKNRTKPKTIRRNDLNLTIRTQYKPLVNAPVSITDVRTFLDATLPPTPLQLRGTIDNRKGTGLAGPGGIIDAGLDGKVSYYLDAEQEIYSPKNPRTSSSYHYPEIRNISPDGRIQQVTWSVGPNGATTKASENSEHKLTTPSYAERRRTAIAEQRRIELAAGKKAEPA